jgi:hypothetical protein
LDTTIIAVEGELAKVFIRARGEFFLDTGTGASLV